MAKKIGVLVLSVLLAVCLACCVYLFFFDRGKDGANGLDGRDGRNGADGVNGLDGADGAKWYVDNGAPASEFGVPGDCYFNLENNSLYQKNESGWELLGVLHQERPSAEMVTITFDARDGVLPAGGETMTVEKGTSHALPVPTRTGFEFTGWFYGEGVNAAQVNDLTVFTRDVTLVAHWRVCNTIVLESTQVNEKVNKIVRYYGTYSGAAQIVVYVEHNGSRLNLTEAAARGWVGSNQFNNSTDGTGQFSGYLQFLETGEYVLIFCAEEPEGTAEAQMHITIS